MSQDKTWFYKSFWLEENEIVFIEMIGDFDNDAIIEMNTHVRDKYLAPASHKIHCVMDATGLSSYPNNLKVLHKATEVSVRHPNMGWVILVGFDNPILRFIGGAIGQILNVNFRQVKSLEEARKTLEHITGKSPAKT